MRLQSLLSLVLLAVLVPVSSPAQPTRRLERVSSGERRLALVIGNNAYQHATPLRTAVADARAVAAELKAAGFEVDLHLDVDRRTLNRAVADFTAKLSAGSIALLFYAGHGVQLQGSNYLIPVDLAAERSDDVVSDGVELGRVLERITAAEPAFSLAILDACRDNPFARASRAFGTSRGLAAAVAPQGFMIVYSAGSNQAALDRLGEDDPSPNGLFTRELLPVLRRPGLKIQDAIQEVKLSVIAKARAVGHQQHPAIYDQSTGTFTFHPGSAPAAAAAPAAPAPDMASELKTITALYTGALGQRVDERAARDRLEKAAATGDPKAVLWLARTHNLGLMGRPQNRERARQLAEPVLRDVADLAEQGDAQALFLIADAHQNALVFAESAAEAIAPMRAACSAGELLACNNLAGMLEGRGVAADDAEAVGLYRRACAGGLASGCTNVGTNLSQGLGVPKDVAEAVTFYRRGCDAGDAAGCVFLGLGYVRGEGLARDAGQAVALFQAACEEGEPRGCLALGVAYQEGEGVLRDDTRAAGLFRKACDGGVTSGCLALAQLMAAGRGMPRDVEQARAIARRACEQKDESGCQLLKALGR